MRLLDRVAQCREPLRVALPGGRIFALPSPADVAARIAAVPQRFVLRDDVRDACRTVLERWPHLLDPRDPLLRIPGPSIWVEWTETADGGTEGGARQVGVYVEADAGGRRGTVRSFWQVPGAGVDLAQAQAHFAFDSPPDTAVRLPGVVCGRGKFDALFAHSVFVVDPAWRAYFRATGVSAAEQARAADACVATVWQDLPFLLAFTRLLASQRSTTGNFVDRSALNRARVARRQAPLLDHVEVSLLIGERNSVRDSGICRAGARRHLVRGHLVHRQGRIYWRSSHFRGDAAIPPAAWRTSKVGLARDFSMRSVLQH